MFRRVLQTFNLGSVSGGKMVLVLRRSGMFMGVHVFPQLQAGHKSFTAIFVVVVVHCGVLSILQVFLSMA